MRIAIAITAEFDFPNQEITSGEMKIGNLASAIKSTGLFACLYFVYR